MKTFQAFDFAEKAEIEKLFLDCIEIFKRESFKNENQRLGNASLQRSQNGFQKNKDKLRNNEVQSINNKGIKFSINGTIEEVALSQKGIQLKN